MFNLNHAITEWRRQMTAAGITSADVLAELECHLRDDVERRVQAGVGESDAFQLAVQQMGTASVLQAEFAGSRVAPAPNKRKSQAKLCGLSIGALALIGIVDISTASSGQLQRGLDYLAAAVYLGSLPLIYALRPVIPQVRTRVLVQAAGTFGWLICGVLLMDFWAGSRLLVTGLWAIMPALAVVAWLVDWMTQPGQSLPPGAGGSPRAFRPILPVNPPPSTLTPRAQQAMVTARLKAESMQHDFVGTEHVLLGLLESKDGNVARMLQTLGVEDAAVRREIAELVTVGSAGPGGPPLPFTPRALKAIELAAREAGAMNQVQVGAEHVLLGLLREGSGVAALALKNLKLDLQAARKLILDELNSRPGRAVS